MPTRRSYDRPLRYGQANDLLNDGQGHEKSEACCLLKSISASKMCSFHHVMLPLRNNIRIGCLSTCSSVWQVCYRFECPYCFSFFPYEKILS